MDLLAKKLLVVGYGKSGQSVAQKAAEAGSEVWVYDDKLEARGERREANKFNEFKYPLPTNRYPQIDLVVTSPGIPFNHPVLKLAMENGWPVISEIEFAYPLLKPNFIIGVTGTNGKTTVVELLAHIFQLSGKPFTVAGNIGMPLSSLDRVNDTLILELSSFQLHFIDKFRANIGVILNITEDHLDWHCCFGQYLRDKLRIFENQQGDDIALLNEDDLVLKQSVVSHQLSAKAKLLKFGVVNSADYGIKDGFLTVNEGRILAVDDIKLKGGHNISNALAAMACAREAGLDYQPIIEGLKTFEGLKHRLQFVATKQNLDFYNDSKSTNPDSTLKAIEAFSKPVILIMGGRNKGNDFSSLKQFLGKKIKELILYGEAVREIQSHIKYGIICKSVEEALAIAIKKAVKNDIVLFSPGCSSFDLFDGYAQRGDAFMKAVGELND